MINYEDMSSFSSPTFYLGVYPCSACDPRIHSAITSENTLIQTNSCSSTERVGQVLFICFNSLLLCFNVSSKYNQLKLILRRTFFLLYLFQITAAAANRDVKCITSCVPEVFFPRKDLPDSLLDRDRAHQN